MLLSENQLFDGRYLLVELIGRGASAEVWKATDTKAGDMPVAVKIYKPDTLGPGSAGIAEFQREFTMVYNMTHTNLLHPQGFDIAEGSPYLVMAFCENGSATSMVGRCNEEEILHFVRDVAAGLEYLHDHNITHQDIKPDNVLVDDNCNFMVTDFGISRRAANDAIGGTRAYMAPEVYKGKPEHASDIWSLGATVVELITGQPPYGELGGASQLQNPGPVAINARLSAPVKKLINDMLDPDPRKRPSAASIRAKIDHFRETGSWNRNVQRNKIAYIATGIAALLLCVGLFFWDINRTKVRYYKDYTEIWGVPQGIGPVSALDQKHRAYTYKMEYKGGKLRHLSTVNSMGYITSPSDTELHTKYKEAEFFYTNNGNIDYVKVYNQDGVCIYVKDYNGNLKTIIFKSDDEFGTEKPLRGKTSETSNATNGLTVESCPITRYKINYDEKGRFSRIEYATFQNVDVTDDDMIHGVIFEYDDRNRMTKKTTIGLNGQPRGNKRGLAIKEYAYDDNDNWISIKYMTADGSPSSDGSGVARVDYEYDTYGNSVSEKFYDLEGKEPMLYSAGDTPLNIAGVLYERDDNGMKIKETYLSMDGKPTNLPMGYMKKRYEYDAKGHLSKECYLNEEDSLVNANFDGSVYAYLVIKSNDRGTISEYAHFNKFSEPTEDNLGIHKVTYTLDSVGHPVETHYFDKTGKPSLLKGYFSSIKQEYDNLGRLVASHFLDNDNKPALDENGVSVYRDEFDRSGKILKRSFFGADGKPVLHNNRYASVQYEYDQRGNEISERLFDVEGKPINCMAGWQYCKLVYDQSTNFKTGIYFYDISGRQISATEYKYDERGNIIEERLLGSAGQLQDNTAVEHSEYDANNRVIRRWYTNQAGNKTNLPTDKYHEARFKYDTNGNVTEITYWSTSGEPVLCSENVHKIVKEYNERNQMIHWLNLDTKGNAIKTSYENPPEARFEYDARGNQTVLAILDGKGEPHNSLRGYQKRVSTYNNRNLEIEVEFFDKDGNPTKDKESGYSRATSTYDNHDNIVKYEGYDKDKLVFVRTMKYNRRDQITELTIRDGNGKVPDGYYARIVWEYETDEITPKKQTFYDINNKAEAWRTWNKDKGEWNTPQLAGSSSYDYDYSYSSSYSGGGSSWQQECAELARQCPIKMEEGVILQSVSYGSNYMTMTFKLTEVSKYEANQSDIATMKSGLEDLKTSFASSLPSNVSINIIILDKAGRPL